MGYQLDSFSDIALDPALLRALIDEHEREVVPRLDRLWDYYRNPMVPGGAGRRARLAQEAGLPPRLTSASALEDDRARSRREIVIENDIAWRVHAMVDFMFGRPITILSTARDEGTRRLIERALDAVWESSGGIALLQDMALLGHVHGHVDLVLRAEGRPGQRPAARDAGELEAFARSAGAPRVEVIEPRRGVPILDPADYRRILGYVVRFEQELNELDPGRPWWRLSRRGGRGDAPARSGTPRKRAMVTEVISSRWRQTYLGEELVDEAPVLLTGGRVGVVHVQNVSEPFCYAGQGEVEALIPLQDELNTRLSDRASRVTMQSFKMYLARGIDGFDKVPVGPGQVWSTDNPDASVEAFGGDADSPSERTHIQEVREAMDKASGVPPLASGVVRAKIGNLTSANALKVTLMGLLSRTARKRVTYGRGIQEMCRLILTALDALGVLRTDEADRGVRIEWPDPLPIDVPEQVAAAKAKAELGAPRERVLAELGYAPDDPGVA